MPNRVQCAIRSLHFWCNNSETKQRNRVMPMTAFFALRSQESSWVDRPMLVGNKVNPEVIRKLAIEIVTNWNTPFTNVNIHGLYWAMAGFDVREQAEIAVYFNHRKPKEMKEDSLNKIPADILMRLNQSLDSLEASLTAQDPMIATHLRNSHQLLISYPETVHLLDDSEIAQLITAAQIHSKIEIAKAAVPKTGGRKKITVDDL
jgi:hypothetical protein